MLLEEHERYYEQLSGEKVCEVIKTIIMHGVDLYSLNSVRDKQQNAFDMVQLAKLKAIHQPNDLDLRTRSFDLVFFRRIDYISCHFLRCTKVKIGFLLSENVIIISCSKWKIKLNFGKDEMKVQAKKTSYIVVVLSVDENRNPQHFIVNSSFDHFSMEARPDLKEDPEMNAKITPKVVNNGIHTIGNFAIEVKLLQKLLSQRSEQLDLAYHENERLRREIQNYQDTMQAPQNNDDPRELQKLESQLSQLIDLTKNMKTKMKTVKVSLQEIINDSLLPSHLRQKLVLLLPLLLTTNDVTSLITPSLTSSVRSMHHHDDSCFLCFCLSSKLIVIIGIITNNNNNDIIIITYINICMYT
ncbi:hypothetical protein RFI_10673 [Reticulomyxa filosa]|uniref:Uncharacterized protein n=1 Tax=Reticulomyxa filosa TaxID=46433 RepID=X6NM69_RETFI|nr:hypothetical protein RFI_10673 [Reticulomyxa filosa]|eukprot:ETO26472.1 hypothetical protein RFI_10673 [Reticulomyxa filosa]